MKRVAEEVLGPKQINLIYGGKTPILPAEELKQLGFKNILYSPRALYLATKALSKSMAILKDRGDLNAISHECIKFGDFQHLMQTSYIKRHPEKTSSLRATETMGNETRLSVAVGADDLGDYHEVPGLYALGRFEHP
jgi:2-methylisocitrate lyase-like PEP mutase family enzyme